MDETKLHKRICDIIFSRAKGKQAEALIFSSESALTRFAENTISQNVSERSLNIRIRIQDGGKLGLASVNHTGDKELCAAVDQAVEILKAQTPDKNLLPMASPAKTQKTDTGVFDPATAKITPAQRGMKVRELADACKKRGLKASGILSNGTHCVTVGNSNGIFQTYRETAADVSATVKAGEDFGVAFGSGHKFGDIPFLEVAKQAILKAEMARKPRAIKPGRYTVILEHCPAASLIVCTSGGFSARSYLEGRSFLCGKLGTQVFGKGVNIVDNALDGPMAGMPFDYEGMPRTKILLSEDGVAATLLHDRRSARDFGKGAVSTGHALPQPSGWSPYPMNMSMTGGKRSLEEIIKNTERGILVTQLHYINMLRPQTVDITGMTRNGTYWIENGEIAYPIKNMRMTESVVNALNRVEELSSDLKLTESDHGRKLYVPAMKIRDFHFSSGTEF